MIMQMMPVLALIITLYWIGQCEAQYVLILHNGRQITVQSYREDAGMIKFNGFGGEISIPKGQVKAIRKSGEGAANGFTIPGPTLDSSNTTESSPPPPPSEEQTELTPPPEEERAKEEKEYQQKLLDVNERLKAARDNYSQTIRGTTSSEPSLLTTEAQLKAREDDIISRALDAQYKPSSPATTRLVTPSPFSTLPPATVETQPPPEASPRYGTALPQYTPRQKELSALRSQILDLEMQRERLIEEMNRKNFGSGKLLE
jgi:hypothetical protein